MALHSGLCPPLFLWCVVTPHVLNQILKIAPLLLLSDRISLINHSIFVYGFHVFDIMHCVLYKILRFPEQIFTHRHGWKWDIPWSPVFINPSNSKEIAEVKTTLREWSEQICKYTLCSMIIFHMSRLMHRADTHFAFESGKVSSFLASICQCHTILYCKHTSIKYWILEFKRIFWKKHNFFK